MNERQKHSKLGIASCLIAIGIWTLFFLFFVLSLNSDGFSKFVETTFYDLLHINTGLTVIVMVILFGVIPIGGHILGAIFGIIGSCGKNKQRSFAVIGLILNILPLVFLPLLYAFG